MAGDFESGKLGNECNCGKRGTFVPQAVGDSTIPANPGQITGAVPITRYTRYEFQAQAAEDERVTVRYPAGKITGAVPMDPKEMLVFHDVL